MAQRKREKEKRREHTEEEERKIKRFIHRKTRKRNEDEAKVLKRDQGKGGGRERKTEWERKARASGRESECVCVRRASTCVRACTRTKGRARLDMSERGDTERKRDRCERSGEQEERACFIKCVARGKSARQFSGAKAAADNARPRLKQSVTLSKSLYPL